MPPKKKVVENPDATSDEVSAKPSKKQKVEDESTSSKSKISDDGDSVEVLKNKDGDQYIDLKGTKRVTVRQFKGKTLVDIREFYNDKTSGEMLPGKKGISLNLEQWRALRGAVHQIDEIVNNLEA